MDKSILDAARDVVGEALSACKSVLMKEQESGLEVARQCLDSSEKNSALARKIIEDSERTPEEKAAAYDLLREERSDRKEIRSDHRDFGRVIQGSLITLVCVGFGVSIAKANPELGQKCFQAAGKLLPEKVAK